MRAFAQNINNPLQDQNVLDYITTYLGAIITAVMPLLVLAIIAGGLFYILARGDKSAIESNNKYLGKLALYGIVIIGSIMIFNVILNLIFKIYNAL